MNEKPLGREGETVNQAALVVQSYRLNVGVGHRYPEQFDSPARRLKTEQLAAGGPAAVVDVVQKRRRPVNDAVGGRRQRPVDLNVKTVALLCETKGLKNRPVRIETVKDIITMYQKVYPVRYDDKPMNYLSDVMGTDIPFDIGGKGCT